MGWVDALPGAVVALDTATFIYYAEEHPRYVSLVEPLFDALDHGRLHAVASTVALLEVLVVPLRNGDTDLAQAYRDILLGSEALTLIPVLPEIAEQAAQLRAQYQVRTPDALHLATALHAGATHFITNDDRLPAVSGIHIVLLDDLHQHDAS